MVDVDNVLLLRPAREGSAFVFADGPAPHVADGDRGIVTATIMSLGTPADAETLAYFDDAIVPLISAIGASLLGCFVTEPSENTFPALPVREGEHVFVCVAGFSNRAAYEAAEPAQGEILRTAAATPGLVAEPQLLRLQPTPRSRLIGTTHDRVASLAYSDQEGRADD